MIELPTFASIYTLVLCIPLDIYHCMCMLRCRLDLTRTPATTETHRLDKYKAILSPPAAAHLTPSETRYRHRHRPPSPLPFLLPLGACPGETFSSTFSVPVRNLGEWGPRIRYVLGVGSR